MNDAHLLRPLTEVASNFWNDWNDRNGWNNQVALVPQVPIVPAVPFVFHTFVLIDHRSQPRYSLLIRYSDHAHRFELKRSTQPLDHLRVCRNHSIKARRLP